MNFNQFTIKAQEAVQEAVNLTQARGQQAIEPVHLLQSVMKVGENVTNFIFQKLGMNGQQIALVLDKQIDSLPKVSGGEPYLSRETNEIFQKATQYSKEMGDEFVSLEPMLLALLTVKSTASTILKDAGMTEKDLRNAINELRKGEKVTSQSSEDTYQSLEKYVGYDTITGTFLYNTGTYNRLSDIIFYCSFDSDVLRRYPKWEYA